MGGMCFCTSAPQRLRGSPVTAGSRSNRFPRSRNHRVSHQLCASLDFSSPWHICLRIYMNETKIARYGNSLTVRLPAALARDVGFREGDRVQIRRMAMGIAIERPLRARLEERLATVRDRETELSSGAAVGAELVD